MSTKLYVGNLPYSATDQSLASAFSEFGTVTSSKVITDRDSGRSKGFAFIEMSTSDEANRSITRMNGANFEGREISVAEAKPQAPRSNGGGFNSRRY